VPPLARRADKERSLDLAENDRIVRHMTEGGLTRFLYGGNAFLYHVTLKEYEQLVDWMSGIVGWAIPSLGPSFGRAMDQAPLPAPLRLPHRDGAALWRPARRARARGGTPRDRFRGGHASRPLPEGRGRLRLGPNGRTRRRRAAREGRHLRIDQVRRRAQGPDRGPRT
jgi:hypothetical protein